MIFKRKKEGDLKYKKSFCLFPKKSENYVFWLEWITIEYQYQMTKKGKLKWMQTAIDFNPKGEKR